jgi:hypothetical protein
MGKYFFGRSGADTDFHVHGPNRGAQYKFGNDKQVIRLDGADGIVYSTDKKGWPGDFLQSIGSFSSDFGNRDTLFLMNRQDGETTVALKNKHASQMKSTTFYGIPELYVNAYALHKNDEPIVGTNDGYVDTHIKDGLFDYNDYKNYENVKYQGENVKGIACPGTSRRGFINNTHIRCVYNDTELRNFSSIKDQYSNSPKRQDIYEKALKSFCKIEANAGKSIDDKRKCIDVINDNEKRNYCFKENRMSNDSVCSKSSLGDSYEILAKEYCENNPDKEFCACYNVTQPGLCDQLPNLPGCKTVKPVWDKITSSLDEGDIAQFEGMQPCYGSVCSGNVYQPTSWDVNCNRDISICKADFDIGGDLLGSNISLKQDCGKEGSNGETTTENKDGDGDEKKSLTEKLFKFEEDKDKKLTEKRSTKIFGTVSSVSSCFMCMTALVLFT